MSQITEQQLAQIKSALKHSKLEAVKIYKSLSGASLLESKQFVESLSDGNSPQTEAAGDNELTATQMDQVLDALGKGQKIEACKLYRNFSGSTLKESKEFVEKLSEELQLELPSGSGCGGAILLFIVGTSAAAYSLLA